ncbi:hypothetical protein KEM48_001904 [Puccinia striiformis f. sp. tritici PST-130]|nr:hypothetical protein KEM48_001904 [Puccinia striiformis f. sp. tritici PST-130]
MGGPNPLILSQILPRTWISYSRLLLRTNSTINGFSSPTSPGCSFNNLSINQQPDLPNNTFDKTVKILKADHLKAASTFIHDEQLLAELQYDISYNCERLTSLLLATQILEELSPKSKDLIIGVGKRLSCRMVTAYLQDQGYKAELVWLNTIVERIDFQSTTEGIYEMVGGQLRQPFYNRIAIRLGERIKQCEDRIPVITGFFGVVPGSLLTQVGRGYTDCSLLDVVTPAEAAGQILPFPQIIEQVIQASIPIQIKNVINPNGKGTVTYPNQSTPSSPQRAPEKPNAGSDNKIIRSSKAPTAITIKEGIMVNEIYRFKGLDKLIKELKDIGIMKNMVGIAGKVFSTSAEGNVNIEMISQGASEINISCVISKQDSIKALNLATYVWMNTPPVPVIIFGAVLLSLRWIQICAPLTYLVQKMACSGYIKQLPSYYNIGKVEEAWIVSSLVMCPINL